MLRPLYVKYYYFTIFIYLVCPYTDIKGNETQTFLRQPERLRKLFLLVEMREGGDRRMVI